MMNPDLLTLFSQPGTLALYEAIEGRIVGLWPDVRIKVSRTQVSFSNRYGFAYVSLRRIKGHPGNYVILTFGLPHEVHDPRIVAAVEAYPRRWTHHVIIEKEADLDAQVMDWVRQSYAYSMVK